MYVKIFGADKSELKFFGTFQNKATGLFDKNFVNLSRSWVSDIVGRGSENASDSLFSGVFRIMYKFSYFFKACGVVRGIDTVYLFGVSVVKDRNA